MKQGEDPHILFLPTGGVLGVLLIMLDVLKDDRTVCSIMLKGLIREYSSARENIIISKRYVRNNFLELSVESKPIEPNRHAFMMNWGKGVKRRNHQRNS